MKRTTTIGKMYAVTSAAGCTVTTPDGLPICTVEAGTQGYFTAPTSTVEVDDDAALLTATFNRAALALRLLGGGVKSELPAGYLRCDSIYSNGNARTTIPFLFSSEGHSLYVTTEHKNTSKEEFQGEFNSSLQMGIYNNASFFMNLGDGFALSGLIWGAFNKCTYSVANKTLTISANGKKRQTEKGIFANVADFTLFYGRGNYPGYKRSFILAVDNVTLFDFKPSISPSGKVTWFNSVDKKEYPATSGVYTAVFTLAQARKLGKHLPAGGGALTISLPTGYEQDAAVAESLETARAKGWTLTIQTYTPEAEAAAATFGMRRIWVRRQKNEHGAYVDADGVRWAVDWCVDMLTPDGSTPDAHGYELYRSTEAAVAYWELSAWVDPEEEQEFLTTESL